MAFGLKQVVVVVVVGAGGPPAQTLHERPWPWMWCAVWGLRLTLMWAGPGTLESTLPPYPYLASPAGPS